jgi:hypothetical protein
MSPEALSEQDGEGNSPDESPAKKLTPEQVIILALIAACKPGGTINPTDAARAAYKGKDPDGWRKRLPAVRHAAIHLARAGTIAIYRKGKTVDPEAFKGVYRLGPPGDTPIATGVDESAGDA